MSLTLQTYVGDCVTIPLPDDSVDLVFASPPYASQRSYGIDFKLTVDEWVHWAADRFVEHLRVSRGLVCWVVEGFTKKGTFHPLPELLVAELMRRNADESDPAQVNIRRRCIYKKKGLFGGNPDDFAQEHEIIIRASKFPGRLPYAKPAELGHPPKWRPGGKPTYHGKKGRINQEKPKTKSSKKTKKRLGYGSPSDTRKSKKVLREYKPPAKCKISDVIDCGVLGGGNMGSLPGADLYKKNEAPFTEKVVLPFVVSYCPEGGTVLDPFSGSGTTAAVAIANGRHAIAMDIRSTQIDLTVKRTKLVQPELLVKDMVI